MDFGHVERAVEGIGGRAKVQRLLCSERKKLIGLPVTQGGEYFCLSNFLQIFPQSVTFKLPTLAHSSCQNSSERLRPLLKAGW